MTNAREIRLLSDYEHLRALAGTSGGSLMVESVSGRPPDHYVLRYACRSIERLEGEQPVYRDVHRVDIRLPARYPAPSAPPAVKMLTPLFHPHVYRNLVVCMGSWQTSEFLDIFALRLGALLQYEREYLDVRDPANEAAVDWAKRHWLLFPTDTRTFRGDSPVAPNPAASAAFQPLMPLPDMQESPDDAGYGADGILWEDLS